MPYRPRRWPRLLHYGLILGAGVDAIITPSIILTGTLSGYLILTWVLFMSVGSAVAFVGCLRNSWLGEYIGLPLIIFAIGGYGLLATAVFVGSLGHTGSLVAGLLYLGFAFGLSARWAEVNGYRKTARQYRHLTRE